MIVEFIGTTGSGKTTLLNQVREKLCKLCAVTTSSDLVTGLVGLQGIKNITARNLVQETISLPYFLSAYPKHSKFITKTVGLFSRNTPFSIMTINNLRSIKRKIGGLEIAQRQGRNKIILVDEGPFLTAHMFAFNDTPLSQNEIEEFISLLPLPDLIIYIKASMEILVERALSRPRPPREMAARDKDENEAYLKRATSIFDQIVATRIIEARTFLVDNSNPDPAEIQRNVDQISEFILSHETI